MISVKLLLEQICAVFINIKDDNFLRMILRNLTAKLAADRSAAARYKDNLILKIAANISVQLNLGASEKIGDINISDSAAL